MSATVHIIIHCLKCDACLEAYADNLKVVLGSLDHMKEEMEFHMKDGGCHLPPDMEAEIKASEIITKRKTK